MHAIVTNIDIELGRSSEATAMLNQLAVPQAQAAAGFITGYWMRSADHAQGTSVELFESQATAEAALAARPPEAPADAPITIISTRLMDVAASA
jgi:hypothetical protein